MSTQPAFQRVAIIGLGLIGSSLARAIRAHGLARAVVGSDEAGAVRDTALALGLVDDVFARPADAAARADLVVIAVPLGAYGAIAKAIGPALAPGAIVTDVGSTKRAVLDALGPHLPGGVHLIPGHPVAGTEKSGPEAGFASLFQDRYCILTPPDGVDAAALARLTGLWEGVGATVELMDPDHHDRVLAITSHLPHLIAYTIVGTAADLESQLERESASDAALVRTHEVIRFSAGGFRDFTRIAGSNPVMWRDVFLTNRAAVLEMLGRFTEDLIALQRAIRFGQGDLLHDWFADTRAIRQGVIDMRQAGSFNPTEPPNPAPGSAADPAGPATAPAAARAPASAPRKARTRRRG